jgi:hypothetical protein
VGAEDRQGSNAQSNEREAGEILPWAKAPLYASSVTSAEQGFFVIAIDTCGFSSTGRRNGLKSQGLKSLKSKVERRGAETQTKKEAALTSGFVKEFFN